MNNIRSLAGVIEKSFMSLAAIVVLDFVLLLVSREYRDVLGTTEGISGAVWRIVLDIGMIAIYGLMYFKVNRNSRILSPLLVCHGLLYGSLGAALCLPWGGYFIAPLTPVGLLYLGSILWVPHGYFVALVVAVVFVTFNIFLVWAGVKLKNQVGLDRMERES